MAPFGPAGFLFLKWKAKPVALVGGNRAPARGPNLAFLFTKGNWESRSFSPKVSLPKGRGKKVTPRFPPGPKGPSRGERGPAQTQSLSFGAQELPLPGFRVGKCQPRESRNFVCLKMQVNWNPSFPHRNFGVSGRLWPLKGNPGFSKTESQRTSRKFCLPGSRCVEVSYPRESAFAI